MEKDLLEALHRAMEAGGVKVKPAVIFGDMKKKPEKEAFVKRLVEADYLQANGANYDVTDVGRQAREKADPEKVAAQREQKVLSLLRDATTGKAVKGASAETLADATARKLIEPGKKANTYVVLPAGKLLLLATAPIDEQMANLRQMLTDLSERFNALGRAAAGQLPAASGDASTLLEQTRTHIEATVSAFRADLAKLQAIPELARLTDSARRQIDEAVAVAEVSLMQQAKKAEAAETMLGQVRAELATYFARLEKLSSERPPLSPAPTPTPGPSEEQMWEATRTAHAKLDKESSVKIPELYDEVRSRFPSLTLKQFHDALLRWKESDRVTLQLCGNREAEKRAVEGIEGSKGLYFYVVMN